MMGQTNKEETHDQLEHQMTIKQSELLVNITTQHCVYIMNPKMHDGLQQITKNTTYNETSLLPEPLYGLNMSMVLKRP